jgi:hypothetical protein
MTSWESVLENPEPHGHFVQLYDGDTKTLAHNVGRYLSQGLKCGEGLLVIATKENKQAFIGAIRDLGEDPEAAVRTSRLLFLDAQATLAEFMVDGEPDYDRFEKTVGKAMGKVRQQNHSGLRAYGEMVGVLWQAGHYSAAIRLEEFWNKLLQAGGFTLFCSYPIDVFAKEFQVSGVDALLCDHTHLIPTSPDEMLEKALYRAIEDRLGARASGLSLLVQANCRPDWAILPNAEGIILWLRNNLGNEAEEILGLARHYYRNSQSTTALAS